MSEQEIIDWPDDNDVQWPEHSNPVTYRMPDGSLKIIQRDSEWIGGKEVLSPLVSIVTRRTTARVSYKKFKEGTSTFSINRFDEPPAAPFKEQYHLLLQRHLRDVRKIARKHGFDSTLDKVEHDGKRIPAGLTGAPHSSLRAAYRMEQRLETAQLEVERAESACGGGELLTDDYYRLPVTLLGLVYDRHILTVAQDKRRLIAGEKLFNHRGATTEEQIAAVSRYRELLRADPAERGRVTRATETVAAECGVSRSTVYSWRKKHDG